MPLFTPPTQKESVPGDPLFSRYTIPVGLSVVKTGGVFVTTPYPWLGEIAALVEGTDYFLGGRTYIISSTVADALTADGFTTGT